MTRVFKSKVRKYFWLKGAELSGFLITVFVLAVVFSWNDWGVDVFDPVSGFFNLLSAIFLIACVVFVHHAGQRLFGLYLGYRVEHSLWWPGLLVALLFAILSGGSVVLLFGSGMMAHLVPEYRIGKFRYGPNMADLAKIALSGPVANVFFGAFIKTLEFAGIVPEAVGSVVFSTSIAFAAWNLLFIPPLDGSKILYASRLLYVFLFGCIGSYILMIYLFDFYSFIVAFLIGVILWLVYLLFFEKHF